jgi:hypothetical protein
MKVALCLVLGLAVSAPAFAQSAATGTIRPDGAPPEFNNGHIVTGDDARLELDALAACLLREHQSEILHGLRLPDESRAQVTQLAPDYFNTCMGNFRIHFDYNSLRGSLYKVLFKHKFGASEPVLPATPIDFALTDRTLPGSTDRTVFHGKLLNFAECVVRSNPAAARELVLAMAGSGPEREAFAVLSGNFAGCMTPGVTLSFSKAALFGLIAEAYYRTSVTPQTAGAQ